MTQPYIPVFFSVGMKNYWLDQKEGKMAVIVKARVLKLGKVTITTFLEILN